jgi:excisionase family DNA binding protein
MPTIYPGVVETSLDNKKPIIQPLAVSPRQACLLLGIGNTRLYELIQDGELVSYHEGRARRITTASIHARVARLASAGATPPASAPGPRERPNCQSGDAQS